MEQASISLINMDKKNNKIVKASYKDCTVADRKSFSKSSCLLPISVGQPVHENGKFEATIELINRTFKECTILIDDSVQRHTLKINNTKLSDKEAYSRSLIDGDMWIKRNSVIYQRLTIPYNVIRWDKWLGHEKFKTQLQLIQNLYNNDIEYKSAIDKNIDQYIDRNIKKEMIKDFDYERVFSLCIEYLHEECAAMILWPEGGYEFEIYPTGRNIAMSATYEYIIKPIAPNLLKSVSLRFKKY